MCYEPMRTPLSCLILWFSLVLFHLGRGIWVSAAPAWSEASTMLNQGEREGENHGSYARFSLFLPRYRFWIDISSFANSLKTISRNFKFSFFFLHNFYQLWLFHWGKGQRNSHTIIPEAVCQCCFNNTLSTAEEYLLQYNFITSHKLEVKSRLN